MKLLLVDDDQEFLDMLAEFLISENFEIHIANDGYQALSRLAQESFDLCVLDIMLPDISGIEVLKTLRQSSNLPTLMLTAKSDPFERILGLELGADDYLSKPFEPWELAARIRAILRRSKPRA